MRPTNSIGHRQVASLAWPITIGMLSFTAMGIADAMFVGQLGTVPFAAVGLATVLAYLVAAPVHGLYSGVRVRIAHANGARESEVVHRLGWVGLWLAWPASLLAYVAVLGIHPALAWMGADPEVARLGFEFLSVRFIAMPALFVYFALQSWMQGQGRTQPPMVAVLVGNAVNICLDPILIHGWGPVPAFGVAGASIATGFAWAVEIGVLLWPSRTLVRSFRWPDRTQVRSVIDIGAPMGSLRTLEVLAHVGFVSMLAHLGEARLAAHVIVVRIMTVSFLPGDSLAQAASVLVGNVVGAGRPLQVHRIFRLATVQAVGFMSLMGGLFFLLPYPLVAAFGASEEVAVLAVGLLSLVALIQVVDAVAMVAIGVLNGAGDTRFTMVLGLVGAWGVKLPVAVAAVGTGWGLTGAWMGIAAELALLAVVGLSRIHSGAWQARPSADNAIPDTGSR